MHVKLEVETQPLGNLVIAARNKLVKVFVWMVVLTICAVLVYFTHELCFWALTKYAAMKHLSGLDQIPAFAWIFTFVILIGSGCGFYSMVSEAKQEARWRSE